MIQKADFDIGTLVYIIIAIVAFVTSIIKKKQARQEDKPETENKKTDWRDLFDIPHDDEDEKYVPPVTEVKKEEPKVQPVYTSTAKEFVRAGSIESYLENEGTFSKKFQQNDFVDVIKQSEIGEKAENTSGNQFEIDLEKAIIYSEIIQRKY